MTERVSSRERQAMSSPDRPPRPHSVSEIWFFSVVRGRLSPYDPHPVVEFPLPIPTFPYPRKRCIQVTTILQVRYIQRVA